MSNSQLDVYLAELAQTGLCETDLHAYIYLRKLAHLVANDRTLAGYKKFIDEAGKNIHTDGKYKLSCKMKLRQKIEKTDAMLQMIKLKGERWYLEQCLHYDKNRVSR